MPPATEVSPMSAQSAFSELLRERRRAAGFSQEELADRAGVSVAAVGSLERGLRRAPHRGTVRALADALSMSEPARKQFEEAAARARGRQPRNISGLPASLTSFIERNEVDELKGLVAERRLLTVTGSPGIGKTRIAIELARRIEDSYDETWFVDLLPIRDRGLVASQIAVRFNVPTGDDDGLSGVVRHIRLRHTLLVIDNCEHVIADVVSVVENLLRHCPLLTIIATSREALAHSAELAYRLPSMDSEVASDLFVTRVQQSDATWSVDAQRLAVVADICKTLDGIPLAIELAASRVSSLGLEALRSRLGGGITLTGSRDLPPRHQTMTATIAWSYDLLSDVEAQLFRRLSVLVGGFTLELAENVGHGPSLAAEAIADVLSHLVQKSLVNVNHVGTSTRYAFLESIRSFGLQRLMEAGELEKTMLCLIIWLKRKGAILESLPHGAEAMVESRLDIDNMLAAVRWAESSANYATIVSAAEVLIAFARASFGHSRAGEVRAHGLSLLEHIDERESPEIIGRLIHRLAWNVTGAELLTLAPQAIRLLTQTGHPDRAAYLHAESARIECSRGNAAAAEDHLAHVAALLNTPELKGTGSALVAATTSAYVRCALRDFSGARACLEHIEIAAGERYEVEARIVLAEVEFYEGHIEEAIELSKISASELSRYPNANHLPILVFGNLATYLFSLRDAGGSEGALRKSLGLLVDAQEFGFLHFAVSYARYVAALVAQAGRADFAARLLGACDAADHRGDWISVRDELPRDVAQSSITEQLSPQQAKALHAQGAGEDMYALLEEFLAQPAASESARLSATSSP